MSHRKTLLLGVVLAASALLPGCRSNPSGAAGAGIGALLGGGAGYAIGHHRGNRTNYALAGAGIGALAGYLIGDTVGDNERRNRAGPDTIDGTDGYRSDEYRTDGYRTERVVRRRVYYGESRRESRPCDDPDCGDPRW